jgi:hypothetical protein
MNAISIPHSPFFSHTNHSMIVDEAIYAKKTAKRKEFLEAERAKENTFHPIIFTKQQKSTKK